MGTRRNDRLIPERKLFQRNPSFQEKGRQTRKRRKGGREKRKCIISLDAEEFILRWQKEEVLKKVHSGEREGMSS